MDSLTTPGNGTTGILDPAGRYTLRNAFGFGRLVLALDVAAEIRPAAADDDDGISPPAVVRETFAIEIVMRDVLVSLYLFVGANSVTLFGVPIGSISHAENLLDCLLTIVDDAEITELVVAADVEAPVLRGLDDADGGTGYLIRVVAEALLAMYGGVLSEALPVFLASSAKDAASGYIRDMMDDASCPVPDANLTGLVDYRDLLLPEEDSLELPGRGGSPYGGLSRRAYGYVGGMLSATSDEDGTPTLSRLMAMLPGVDANDRGGVVLAGGIFGRSIDASPDGLLDVVMELSVSNVTLSNVDSIASVRLAALVMGEPSVLDSEASAGVGTGPLRLSLALLVKGKVDEMSFDNEVDIGLSLVDLDVALRPS